MQHLVYKLTRDDNLVYIGSTNTDRFKIRMAEHASSDRFKDRSFVHEIMFRSEDRKKVLREESRLIKHFDSYRNGLNHTPSGQGANLTDAFTTSGFKFSEESRQRMSVKRRAYIERLASEGRKMPMCEMKRGPVSDETRKKLSAASKRGTKLNQTDVELIRAIFASHPILDDQSLVGTVMRNGKKMTYERLFSKQFADQYGITQQMLYGIITNKARI